MATWVGNNGNNTNFGSQQTQYGLDGADRLSPNNNDKSYFLYGGNGNDWLEGWNYDDQLYGGADADEIYGYGGKDYLEGGAGNDYLDGGKGNDELYGGRGADAFVFSTKLDKKKNVDKIADFESGNDSIFLDNNIFDGVGGSNKTLNSKKFEVGKEATKSKTKILYDKDKGKLYYTPDGDNGKKTLFAQVDKKMSLDHDDFYIISL
jgi:Ca2+-binding RTX toxin-like protein